MSIVKKSVSAFILALVSSVMAASSSYCLFAGVADALTLELRANLVSRMADGKPISSADRVVMLRELLLASEFAPDATEYYQDQGYLYAVCGANNLKINWIAKPCLQQASENYHQALFSRPMSSANWANLALVSYYLDSEDYSSIDLLINTAMNFGASDPSTQKPIFYLAIRRWSSLPSELQNELVQVANHSNVMFKNDLIAVSKNK